MGSVVGEKFWSSKKKKIWASTRQLLGWQEQLVISWNEERHLIFGHKALSGTPVNSVLITMHFWITSNWDTGNCISHSVQVYIMIRCRHYKAESNAWLHQWIMKGLLVLYIMMKLSIITTTAMILYSSIFGACWWIGCTSWVELHITHRPG